MTLDTMRKAPIINTSNEEKAFFRTLETLHFFPLKSSLRSNHFSMSDLDAVYSNEKAIWIKCSPSLAAAYAGTLKKLGFSPISSKKTTRQWTYRCRVYATGQICSMKDVISYLERKQFSLPKAKKKSPYHPSPTSSVHTDDTTDDSLSRDEAIKAGTDRLNSLSIKAQAAALSNTFTTALANEIMDMLETYFISEGNPNPISKRADDLRNHFFKTLFNTTDMIQLGNYLARLYELLPTPEEAVASLFSKPPVALTPHEELALRTGCTVFPIGSGVVADTDGRFIYADGNARQEIFKHFSHHTLFSPADENKSHDVPRLATKDGEVTPPLDFDTSKFLA